MISVAGTEATVSPMRSAALAQPEPSVKAMSWFGTPVSSAIWAAACFAISNGSVVGFSSGLLIWQVYLWRGLFGSKVCLVVRQFLAAKCYTIEM